MKFLKHFGWIELLFGALLMFAGLVTFANPGFAMRWIVLLSGITAVMNGITNIIFYMEHRRTGPTSRFSVFSGIISILAGFALFFNPVFGGRILSFVFAFWFIAHSISRIANAGVIRKAAGGFVYVISAVLNGFCIILGILMLFNPLLLVLSLGYLVAITFFALGIDSVIEAFFRVRRKNAGHTQE